MNIREYLWDAARADVRRGLPILSFPAASKLGVSVEQLVKDSELQAKAIALVAAETDSLAAISLMDLSVEAECFGAAVTVSDDEVPTIKGRFIHDADEAEALAITISTAIAREIAPYIDGYYFMTPFRRVELITKILEEVKHI